MTQTTNDDSEKMACLGASTIAVPRAGCDMEECQTCGARVAWDLVSHWFFGFQKCDRKAEYKRLRADLEPGGDLQ